jgi:hypothetical protein
MSYMSLVAKPEGNRPLGRHRRRWEDSIGMDLKKMAWEGVDWVDLAQGRDRRWAVVNAAVNLWLPQLAGNFLSG